MKYHRAVVEEFRITYQPYIGNIKSDLVVLLIGLFLCGGMLVLLGMKVPYAKDLWWVPLLGLFGIALSLYHILFLDLQTLIFDGQNRCVYKKQFWTGAWRVIGFDQIHAIQTLSECSGFCYGLSRKSNAGGGVVRISNYYKSKKIKPDRAEFEEVVLPVIAKMVGLKY